MMAINLLVSRGEEEVISAMYSNCMYVCMYVCVISSTVIGAILQVYV